MTDNIIKIGIDLGTTNSEVAIHKEGQIEIIKNIHNDEYTPSVFGVDKSKNKIVGKKAYEKVFRFATPEEQENNKAEIKRLMGTSEETLFKRLGKKLKPEEISAEILKSLKEDISRKYSDFDTNAAVITIPAYFSTLQAEATKRAGLLAGFDYVVLLQEPIAAAVSFGFMGSKNENWLIYDLGGGTFDVALISSKGGTLSVLGHRGDNFLGGKDIDLLIVDKIIVPKLLKEFKLEGFNRKDPKYSSQFASLKYRAENAKIELSQREETVIEIDKLGDDNEGQEIYLNISLTANELQKLMKPLVDRTIDLTRETIKESGLKTASIDKIVLVGAPTQMPYIRKKLEKDLKIPIDSSSDPMTAVARGAAIFAISQRIPEEILKKKKSAVDKGRKKINLFYDTLTSETEESVTGIVEGLSNGERDYHIQIQSDSGSYTGSKNKIKDGKFFESITLESNKENLFWIYLFDDEGNNIPIEPESFSIVHGVSISGAPIPHSIGVAVIDNIMLGLEIKEEFDPFFEKNSILPLKHTKTYQTVRRLKKGDKENALPIKVFEGDSNKPDRNHFLAALAITGKQITHDLPEGTDIDVTIEVSESREVFISGFIPSIDLPLDTIRATIHAEDISLLTLEDEVNVQANIFDSIKRDLSSTEQSKVENTIQSIRTSVQNAGTDEDEKRKADSKLKELKNTIDTLQQLKEMPQLLEVYNEKIEQIENLIKEEGVVAEENKSKFSTRLDIIKREGVTTNNDKVLIISAIQQLEDLLMNILTENPSYWVHLFEGFSDGSHDFTDTDEANRQITKGRNAIQDGDMDRLRHATINLIQLLPQEEQKRAISDLSGITKK